MNGIGYMDFFVAENRVSLEHMSYIEMFFLDDEIITSFFKSMNRWAFFTNKRMVFLYVSDGEFGKWTERQVEFIDYKKIQQYQVVENDKFENVKVEVAVPGEDVLAFNFENRRGAVDFVCDLRKLMQ